MKNKEIVKPIPEAVVEKTWQEVAGFSPDKAKKEMRKVGNPDKLRLAFIILEKAGFND